MPPGESFEPLTAVSGPAMHMRLKKEKYRRLSAASISRMRRHAPNASTDLQICVLGHVADISNCVNVFFKNRPQGFGAGGPRKMAFPIENVHRPYNSVSALYCALLRSMRVFARVNFMDFSRSCTTRYNDINMVLHLLLSSHLHLK